MKLKKTILVLMIVLACLGLFVGCGGNGYILNIDGAAKVVFELEGGTYLNCKESATYYYKIKEGGSCRIVDLQTDERDGGFKGQVLRNGYKLEGWYRTRTEGTDGEVTYSDKWNFETDRVNVDGVTLYAKWEKIVRYTYSVNYKLESNGNTVFLGAYDVEAGAKFEDKKNYANTRSGYTPLGYFDEEGNPWNTEFTHPGGETSCEVKVFVAYEKAYTHVSTAEELKKAVSANKDIWLDNDIDFAGAEFSFGSFNKILMGNNKSVKNFKLTYPVDLSSLVNGDTVHDDLNSNEKVRLIGLFSSLNRNSVIKDVAFEGVTLDLNINLKSTAMVIFAPLAVKAGNATVENVTITGTITCTQLPSGYTKEQLLLLTDKACYMGDESRFTNVSASFTDETGSYFAKN